MTIMNIYSMNYKKTQSPVNSEVTQLRFFRLKFYPIVTLTPRAYWRGSRGPILKEVQ